MVAEEWLALGGNLVDPAVAPRVTTQHAPRGHHEPPYGAMSAHRLKAVAGTRGVVLTRRTDQGRHDQLVDLDEPHQGELGKANDPPGHGRRAHLRTFDSARAREPSTSLRNSANDASAAAGSALTTTWEPAGTVVNASAMTARRRRFTRLRTTAPPTARETAKPAMLEASPVFAMYTTAVRPPALPPRRIVTRKSSLRRRRAPAANTRPTENRGPDDGGPSKWRVPHGCDYAGGSRASWHAFGYSAGKSACSREYSTTFWGMGKSANSRYALTGPRSNLTGPIGH